MRAKNVVHAVSALLLGLVHASNRLVQQREHLTANLQLISPTST